MLIKTLQYTLIAFTIICTGSASAQEGRVRITEHGDVASVVASYRSKNTVGEKIGGYRVRIFFDNSQQARSISDNVLNDFTTKFPDIPTYQVYQNPYFKVSVGNCLNRDEAFMLWGRVKDQFPGAFIVREDILLKKVEPVIDADPAAETVVAEPEL